MSYSTIWTTKSVNKTLEQLRFGADVNLDCFHQRDPELKANNVLFQLSEEEEAEFIRCSQDIDYFVEKYCQFLTDYGRKTVDLRDFQKDILNTIGEEVWIEDIEDFGPKVRNYILMASRQTGKCLSPNVKIRLKNTKHSEIIEIPIYLIYNRLSRKKSILSRIKFLLYKINSKLSEKP